MRFTISLQKANIKFENNESDSQSHIYDNVLYDKYMLLSKMYDDDNFLIEHSKEITNITHPFEIIRTKIKSTFVNKEMKITNAFMKMYEMLYFLTFELKCLEINNTLTMYDIAGAPGMFVFATEKFLSKYFKNTNLDWYSCSLFSLNSENDSNTLCDTYGLYQNNNERYQQCDVLKVSDLQNIINKQQKYYLVTGDIGIYHEDDWNKLQEETHLDLQYGQMILGLNIVQENGILILKMYSFATYESIYLLDLLTNFFETVYITKPYTSRLLNSESYIICIKRNSLSCSNISLQRPKIKIPYKSINIPLIKTFEYNRLDIKFQMISFAKRILEKYPKLNMKKLINNYLYKQFFSELSSIYKELENLK